MTSEPESPTGQAFVRKLATILSADVAEYSRLMAEDEEQTLTTFRAHKEVFQSLVALHRGRIFNTAGDAILAEFGSAVEAVRCATEIQAAARTRNEQLAPSRQVRFRIGVNLGDVMVQGSDLLGDGVNVAARLQGAAEPGGICISGSVYDQIINKLSLGFRALGEQRFKNIPQPVRTFTITEAEGLGNLPSPGKAPRERRSGAMRWLAAAVLLLVAASGWWAYSENERAKTEQARIVAQAEADKQAAAQREAQLAAEKQAAEAAQQRAEAERQAAEQARLAAENAAKQAAAEEALQRSEAERQRLEAEKRAADLARQQAETDRKRAVDEQTKKKAAAMKTASNAPSPAPAPAAPPAKAPAAATSVGGDGLYGGPVCYGPSPQDPARCFRAQANLSQGHFSGQWPSRDPGDVMTLSGQVAASGDVMIEMHGTRADGSRFAQLVITGTLKDGRLDATGSFANGRTASLNWRHF